MLFWQSSEFQKFQGGGKNPLIQETLFQENDKEVFVKLARLRKFKETEYVSIHLLCLYDS